jgi:hypothetical protein
MRPNLPFVSAKHTLVTYNITLSLITKTNQGPRCFQRERGQRPNPTSCISYVSSVVLMGRKMGSLQLLAPLLLTGGKGADLVTRGNIVLNREKALHWRAKHDAREMKGIFCDGFERHAVAVSSLCCTPLPAYPSTQKLVSERARQCMRQGRSHVKVA